MRLDLPSLPRNSSDPSSLGWAFDLVEAAGIITVAAASTATVEAKLTRQMRTAFNKQGTDFLKRFVTLKSLFEGRAYMAHYWPGYVPLLEAIQRDDWAPLWDETVLATVEILKGPIDDAAEAALLAGGRDQIANLRADFSFELDNPRAQAYLKEHGARQVVKINEETRSQLRTILVQANDDGWSYQRTAKEIRGKFDGFRGKSPLLHIRDRAELVAVTEVGNAYEAGAAAVANGLQERGLAIEKHWFDAGDARVHPGCRADTGAGWIPLLNRFPSGAMQPLDHPGCRCHAQYRRVRSNRPAHPAPPVPLPEITGTSLTAEA